MNIEIARVAFCHDCPMRPDRKSASVTSSGKEDLIKIPECPSEKFLTDVGGQYPTLERIREALARLDTYGLTGQNPVGGMVGSEPAKMITLICPNPHGNLVDGYGILEIRATNEAD